MISTPRLLTMAAASLLTALAGCATTQGNLTSSADRLERNTESLARSASADSDSDFARRASELADEAQEFRETVNDREADHRDLTNAFEELSRDYHALRDDVDRSGNRDDERDFEAVTDAYLDVERELSRHADPDTRRYARDRDSVDR